MRRHAFRIVLGAAVCLMAGCGPKLTEVNGKVTYNGQPPDDVGCTILFLGPDGQEVTAAVAPTGEYKAIGVVVGANKVAVYYSNPEAAKPRKPGEKAPPSTSPLKGLPSSYADVKTSELAVTVAPGTEFNVEMKGPPLK